VSVVGHTIKQNVIIRYKMDTPISIYKEIIGYFVIIIMGTSYLSKPITEIKQSYHENQYIQLNQVEM